MSEGSAMTTTPETPCHDWSRFDAMTDAERHAAALKDPDAQPLTQERMANMTRTPRGRVIRRTGETAQRTAAFDEMWDKS